MKTTGTPFTSPNFSWILWAQNYTGWFQVNVEAFLHFLPISKLRGEKKGIQHGPLEDLLPEFRLIIFMDQVPLVYGLSAIESTTVSRSFVARSAALQGCKSMQHHLSFHLFVSWVRAKHLTFADPMVGLTKDLLTGHVFICWSDGDRSAVSFFFKIISGLLYFAPPMQQPIMKIDRAPPTKKTSCIHTKYTVYTNIT